jgi:ankyrin repeat protein
MKESEQVDTFYNDKTLLSNNELEKELLLDNPLNINIDTKQTKNSFLSPSNEMDESNNFINTMNKHNNNQNSQIDINKDNKFKGKRASPSLKKEDNFEKNLLYNIDFENTDKITEIIKENSEKVISVINDDMNILQRATFLNKISSVKTIVKELKKILCKDNDTEKYNNFINSKNKRGYTSLHYSIVCGNIEIYLFLIKNGADRTISTNSGYNNLILACQTKRTYIFLDEIKNQIIDKQLDLSLLFNFKDKNKATLLHWAAFSNYQFGVQYLLSLSDKNNISYKNININFINFINSKDNDNMTALQYAIMNNSNKAIFDIMLLNDIDLYNKDVNDRDCFDYADSMNNETFREALKIKNTKCNSFKKFIKIFLFIIHNALIYFILLPLINKFYILIIQLSLNFLIIIDMILVNCIINPGNNKGNISTYKNMLFNINENSIYKDLNEIIRYCPYCYKKKEKTSTTKHCPICNICVDDFIKHDTFFNICIGKKNYCFYMLFNIIFLFYLLYFIFVSFWSIFINSKKNNDTNDIFFLLIKIDLFYNEIVVSIISFGTIFIFIWIFFITLLTLYKECRLKSNALRQSNGPNKMNTNFSRNESIM